MDAINTFVITCLLGLFLFSRGSALPEDVHTTSSCNGLTATLNCTGHDTTADGLIFVRNVKLGAKPKTEDCPFTGYKENCCQVSAGDCTAESADTQSVRESCMDHTTCEKTLDSTTITCTPADDFQPASNFFKIDYYCIDESRAGSMCTSLSETVTSPDAFYLRNQWFPNPISADDTSCTCSIETDKCDGHINIGTPYLKLVESDGTCSQSLSLVDGELSSIFTCENSSDYAENVMVSTGTYLMLELTNAASTDIGKFMLGFQASGNGATLHVNCPAKTQEFCSSEDIPTTERTSASSLPDTSPDVSMTTVTAADSDNSTTVEQTTVVSNTTESSTDDAGLISVSGACLLIMLSLAAIVP